MTISGNAKITSKGQVTIPAEVRVALRLREGDTVTFEVAEDGSASLRPVRGESAFAKYKGSGRKGGKGKTIEQILAEQCEMRGW